jgi:hypothetical protein
MKKNGFRWMVRVFLVLVPVVATGALAQAPMPEHFSGIISDYTPSIPSTKPNTAATPPYEMRGHWSLHLNRRTGKADFSAIMAMEFSDYWLLTSGADPTNSALRGQHTHHITMADATVAYDAASTSACPAYAAPTPTNPGFVVTGMADITGNGSTAPFQMKSGLSALQVCINGGAEVEFSNISLLFLPGAPAIGHFGSQAIHGVVRFPHKSDKPDHEDEDRH